MSLSNACRPLCAFDRAWSIQGGGGLPGRNPPVFMPASARPHRTLVGVHADVDFLADEKVAARILDHLGLDSTGPPAAPPRRVPEEVEPPRAPPSTCSPAPSAAGVCGSSPSSPRRSRGLVRAAPRA